MRSFCCLPTIRTPSPRLIGRQISSSLAETNWLPNAAVRNAPARILLTVIDKNPAAVRSALNPAVGSSKHTTVRVSRHGNVGLLVGLQNGKLILLRIEGKSRSEEDGF
jgi:hypothetical protein